MILVTDGEQRSSLAVVRSLGRAGHQVAVCSAQPRPLAGASRHSRATHRVPDPASDADGFTRAVDALVDALGVRVLIPMTDVSAPLLLGLRERRPKLTIPFPDLDAYERLSDKAQLTRVAAELGVPVPRQVVLPAPPASGSTVLGSTTLGELGWPVIVKPARSAVRVRGRIQKLGVSAAGGDEELSGQLARHPPEAFPILLQQRIVGPGLGVFVLAAGGRVIAAFAHRRIREKPPTGGVSVYRESIPLRSDLREHAERLTARLAWSGALMLEFKEDASTGTPYLMEGNGRFWGSLQLAVDAGVDFPRLLVESALGAEVEPVRGYRYGVRSRWLWGDVDHLLWMLRAPGGYRSQHPYLPGRLEALGRFLVPWRPGDRYEVLRLSDPRPFLRESVQWVRGVLG